MHSLLTIVDQDRMAALPAEHLRGGQPGWPAPDDRHFEMSLHTQASHQWGRTQRALAGLGVVYMSSYMCPESCIGIPALARSAV